MSNFEFKSIIWDELKEGDIICAFNPGRPEPFECNEVEVVNSDKIYLKNCNPPFVTRYGIENGLPLYIDGNLAGQVAFKKRIPTLG